MSVQVGTDNDRTTGLLSAALGAVGAAVLLEIIIDRIGYMTFRIK